MGYLIVPLIFGIMSVPDPTLTPARLADFARLQRALAAGGLRHRCERTERRLKLVDADDLEVTFSTGAQSIVMQRDAVVYSRSRARLTLDGTLKGAAIGLIMGLPLLGATRVPRNHRSERRYLHGRSVTC